jgi:hypothetical protein
LPGMPQIRRRSRVHRSQLLPDAWALNSDVLVPIKVVQDFVTEL